MSDKDDKLREEFLKWKYGPRGGQTVIQNLSKSKDRYPKVQVNTLEKTDPTFKKHLDQLYNQWRQSHKPEGDSPTRTKTDLPMPPGVRDLHKVFKDAGHELYLVGGAVRDHVLGKTPKDYDLATDADPDKVLSLLKDDERFNKKLDITGKDFGVVRVFDPQNEEYEIATFREDVGEGRRPDEVKFTSIDEDVKRRDLTINALFYDLNKNEIVDFVGGVPDAQNKVIRTVGNPEDRFREDKLRILRVLRFAGRMNGKIDEATKNAIQKNPSLEGVSPERTRDEFENALRTSQKPSHFLNLMDEMGLYDQVFPGLQINPKRHDSRDLGLQLATLLQDNPSKKINKVLKKMKHKNSDIEEATLFLDLKNLNENSANKLKKTAKKLKVDPKRILEASKHLGSPNKASVGAFVKYLQSGPALSGKDLIDRGIKPGPEMGKIMAQAEKEAFQKHLEDMKSKLS
jgi:tRNA nucleotidyltransferase (CCA-adding enzyme)